MAGGAPERARAALTSGRYDARPELAATAIPLEIGVPALPCRAGAQLARRLFEPLGWKVAAEIRSRPALESEPVNPRL